MENQRQRWVTGVFLAVSVLLAFIVVMFATKVAGLYDLEARIKNLDLIIRGGAFLIGAGTFGLLWSHGAANQFTNEVVAELSRVTWPTQKETSRATVVVIIMALISGLLLGGLDSFWTWVLKAIL